MGLLHVDFGPEKAEQQDNVQAATDSLTAYVQQCFAEAKTAKQPVTLRLLACDRQRAGEYDPKRRAEIEQNGGSDIYVMLTDIKCRAAEAWIKDVIQNAGGSSFGFDPTPEPELPPSVKQEVIEAVMAEAGDIAEQGMPIHPDAIQERLKELASEVREEIVERAKDAAMRMETKVHDILAEAQWSFVLSDAIHDFVTYPAAVIKGPIVRKKKVMKWSESWTPIVTEEAVREFARVSPYDVFPSPLSEGPNSGYLIERHRLSRKSLQDMIGMPGYNDDAIREVLETVGDKGVRLNLTGDAEKLAIYGQQNVYLQSKNIIEAIEFWGSVSGRMLNDWGMKSADPFRDYECNVWVVGNKTIRAVLNPDQLGRRPYSIASFRRVPGNFWGMALPETMSDVQVMCNAAARSLANNMSVASGPQVEVQIDRLPDGEPVTRMFPWKVWQTTTDRSGGGQPAIRFFQPNMNAAPLLEVFQYFARMADEVTGVPNYVYGSTAVSGAGRTASGLSMLMENAAKGIKHAILALDGGINEMLQRLFESLMLFDPDPSIKGDMKIVPRGIVATMIKEGVEERRMQFLQATTNPIDAQIMGPAGRGAVLREVAKRLEMDTDDVVPESEEINARQQLQQLLAAMQAAGIDPGAVMAAAQQQMTGGRPPQTPPTAVAPAVSP